MGDDFVVLVDQRLRGVVLEVVRLQLRLFAACCRTQALARLAFIQLLDALEADLSEATYLLVT